MTDGVILSRVAPAEDVLNSICACLPEEHHEKAKEAIIDAFAGSWVYFPKSLQRDKRNKEMLARFFSGESRSTLCREYRISRSALHQIIVKYHIHARVHAKCSESA